MTNFCTGPTLPAVKKKGPVQQDQEFQLEVVRVETRALKGLPGRTQLGTALTSNGESVEVVAEEAA